MELGGDEKRIQALFRELRAEDDRLMTGFSAVCGHARLRKEPKRIGIVPLLAGVALLICITLASLATWRRGGGLENPESPIPQPRSAIAGQNQEAKPAPTSNQPESFIGSSLGPRRGSPHSAHATALARRRRAELAERQLLAREAAAISSWQSPTEAFLHMPGDEVIKALPALGEAGNDLKAFLSNRSLEEK